MTKKLIIEAAENLKKALPLMIRHKVPTTPVNYALWYTYVSKQVPELNDKFDVLLAQNSVYPPIRAELLYRKFVVDKTETSTDKLKEDVEKMLKSLGHSIQDTHSNTNKFQKAINQSLKELKKVEKQNWSIDEIMKLVKIITVDSKKISHETDYFNKKLEKATKEIKSLKSQLKKTQKLALFDSLTGLLNRYSFDTELSAFLENKDSNLCLILADIDHFKLCNDEWGHLLGDQVLKEIGRIFNKNSLKNSTAYRFGGEEFAVLIQDCDLAQACQFAEKLRKNIEKLSVQDKRTCHCINTITASFGVSKLDKNDLLCDFIERADQNLYQAKNLGRNRVFPV